MNRKIKILGIGIPLTVIVFLSILVAVTVFTAVEQAAKGAELVYLEAKGDKIAAENSELSSKLIMDSSLSKVAEEASVSGLIKPDKIMYLTSEAQAVAKLQ